MDEQLQQLKDDYQEEQDVLALMNKQGAYESEEEYMEAQKFSWEYYVIQKFKITNSKKDRDYLIDYFAEQTMGDFIDQRDKYLTGNETLEADKIARKQLFIDFEDMMIDNGIIKARNPEDKDIFLNNARDEENSVVPETVSNIDNTTAVILCTKQLPIAQGFFNYFKEQDV